MQWQYDLAQGEPIIRDLPVGGSSDILEGAVVSRATLITTADNNFGFINASASTINEVVGVSAEFYDYSAHISNTGSNAATAALTGITNYIKVIVNPLAIWLAEWSQHADDDSVNTAASTTGKVITGTFTDPGDDVEGNWVYITNVGSTTGGAGNLFQIGAASTTTYTACTSFDDNLAANNTSDTYIKILSPYFATKAGGSMALSAATGQVGTHILGNDLVGDDVGAALVIQNWIQDRNTGLSPLRVEKHSGKTFDAATCKLFASIQLRSHLLLNFVELESATIVISPQVD